MKRHFMRLLSILLILSLVLGSGQTVPTSYAATASGPCGDKLTWVLDGGTLTISGEGEMDLSSPDLLWYGAGIYKNIKTVVIEDGVTSIGAAAFADCSSLENVTIPGSVRSIGDNAFRGCKSLESVTISEGVKRIGEKAFGSCTSLESVTIPNSIESFGAMLFEECTSLKSVTFLSEPYFMSTSGEGIGSNVFNGCTSLETVWLIGERLPWFRLEVPGSTAKIYFVYVSADYNEDGGTVEGDGMYEDDSDGDYPERVNITLKATPKEGYVFAGWEKNGKIIHTEKDWEFKYGSVCDIEGSHNHYYLKLKAVFKKELTITANDQTYTYDGQPQGEADPPYNDPAVIKEKVTVKGLLDGDQVTSIVLAGTKTEVGEYKDAIEITGFTINDDSDAVNKYAVTTVPGKLTIKAPDPTVYEITATENLSTWGTVAGGGTYNESDSVTLTAFPNDGYVFDCWTEGGTRVDGAGAEYTFTANCARNLVANFREIVVSEVNIANTTYTGKPAVQDFSRAKVELRNVDVTLQEGTDYKFVYENNVDAGTATVHLDFIKDFTGSKSFPFVIQPKPLTIAADDEAFTYDGEAHSNAGYTVQGLCGDDAVKAVVTGSITFPSESPVANKIESYEFTSGKADNYDVTTADGQLTMQKASVEITLTAGSGEWTYDGEAHGNTEVTVTSGILFPGDELVASASGSVTDVADSAEGNNPVADGYKILHGDEDVTENYVITTVAGTLTILPAEETPEEKPQKPQKEKEEKEEPEEEALPFKDVQKTDYFYDAVKWAWEKGMTAGVTEDLFGPALGCTRAQFVTLLYGAAGSPEVSGDMPFSDVPEDLYFYRPVLWAYQNGITAGNSDGTFGAAQTVTRAQAVTMLYGMKGRPEVSGDMPFSDVPEDAYYYAPVLWAYGQGITAGTGDGAFSPEDPCTRAQIVTMLCAALTE